VLASDHRAKLRAHVDRVSSILRGLVVPTLPRWARQLAPWLIGLGIVALILSRIPIAAFREAVSQGNHVALALVSFAVALGVLLTDAVSTRIGLAASGVRWGFLWTLALRGASYVLAVVNYAVGQVGLGYYLHRAGVSAARSVGITLFLTGTTFAALVLVTTLSWGIDGRGGVLWWTLLALCAGLAVYLMLVAAAPSVLARHQPLAPLFDARLSGYAVAIAGRVPHVLMLTFGVWFSMRAWGLAIPLSLAATTMPGVVIATTLPISPGGLGTAQAAMVVLFAQYAPGATPAAREANILAFGVANFVYSIGAQVVIGLACQALLRRLEAQLPDGADGDGGDASRLPTA
jgi:hypothetical protein